MLRVYTTVMGITEGGSVRIHMPRIQLRILMEDTVARTRRTVSTIHTVPGIHILVTKHMSCPRDKNT